MLKFIKHFKGCYIATLSGVTFTVETLDSGEGWAMRINGDDRSDWTGHYSTKKKAVDEANRLATSCIEQLTLEFGVL